MKSLPLLSLSITLAVCLALPVSAEIRIPDAEAPIAVNPVTTKNNTTPEPISQCARLVHGCFGEDQGEDRTNCFFSSSKHPFCQGTELGKLTYQRWMMSPVKIGGLEEGAPSFLGPQLVNQECLEGFDTYFVGSLVKEENLRKKLPSLSERLSSCVREISPELSRP